MALQYVIHYMTYIKSKPPALIARGGGFVFQHLLYLCRYVVEEVVIEYNRYSPQQLGVDGSSVEYVVCIYPVTVELSGKPRHRVFLRVASQYFLNFVADVHGRWGSGGVLCVGIRPFLRHGSLVPVTTKSVRALYTLPVPPLEAYHSPHKRNRQRRPHADMHKLNAHTGCCESAQACMYTDTYTYQKASIVAYSCLVFMIVVVSNSKNKRI